jgi:hypothetical protein
MQPPAARLTLSVCRALQAGRACHGWFERAAQPGPIEQAGNLDGRPFAAALYFTSKLGRGPARYPSTLLFKRGKTQWIQEYSIPEPTTDAEAFRD